MGTDSQVARPPDLHQPPGGLVRANRRQDLYPFERFTERAKKVLTLAQEEAERSHHSYIGTEHLLLGLLREGEGLAAKVLNNLGVEINKVRSTIEFGTRVATSGSSFSRSFRRRASRRSSSSPLKKRVAWATTTSAPSTCCSACSSKAKASPRTCSRSRRQPGEGPRARSTPAPPVRPRRGRQGNPAQVQQDPAARPVLPRPDRPAQRNTLDPVIGRAMEIERVVQILSRRTKNNPALIGEPGVGKTAIAEGLAQAIILGQHSRSR